MATILVADDRAEIRLLLRRILEPPHQVREAVDGYDALVKLRERPPAIAILDVDMPRMTGLDLCQQIRADPQLAATKVIIMTASGVEDESGATLAGADGFLSKPFSPTRLLALVDTFLTSDVR